MRKRILLVCMALMSLFGVFAATVPPINSTTNGSDVWYYIKCLPRSTDANAKWLTGAPDDGTSVVTNTVFSTTDDAQLWKVVTNADGFALVNKKYGTYLNADQTPYPTVPIAESVIKCVTAAPAIGLKVVDYVDQNAVPNGFYMVNASATGTINNSAANTTTTFQFYSAGSGSNFRPINYGPSTPNVNSAVVFLTPKDILNDAIAAVTKGLANSSAGYNPGQFDPNNIEQMQYALDDAKVVYDAPASTNADYLTAAVDLNSVFAQFKTTVNLPALSIGSENWYYIQGTRPANTYMTAPAAGAGTQVKDLPVIPDDTQLWKLVPNGTGFAMQNKASSEYLQTDFPTGTNLATQATMPVKPLRFITSGETFNKAYRFWIENTTDAAAEPFRLHAGGSGNGWGLMNWTGGANDNCTWLFLSQDELFRTQFVAAKTSARDMYTNSIEGDEFGQFTAAKRAAFNTIVAAEEAKNVGTMTQEELKAGTKTLEDAIAAFKANNDVSTLSSVTKIKWFRFINAQSPAGYATGKAMTSNGRVQDQAYTYETKDVNSDAQLFRFELNADGTKATTIVNKATNLYVSADGKLVAAPTADNEFELTALDSYSFWIKPTTADAIHAAAYQTDIVNWPSGANSASAWKFEYVKSEDVADVTPAYTAKRTQARAKYNAASALGGVEFGQYSAASIAALNTVITAEEAKDPATMTKEQMLQGYDAMNAAIAALQVNTDVKLLVSNVAGKFKWFRLVNNQSGSGYASNMAMSSNGRIETEHFTYEVADINSDAQLFRFELTADLTKVAHIINKANGLYVAADGIMAKTSTTGNDFEITQLAGGRSFWIDPTNTVSPDPNDEYLQTAPLHAAYAGTSVVNWLSGAGSASAWLFEFVKESYPDAVKNVQEFNYNVRINNHIITVDGVENFEVYSVLGQRQNIKKALATGVYFVKVNNAVKKVVVD